MMLEGMESFPKYPAPKASDDVIDVFLPSISEALYTSVPEPASIDTCLNITTAGTVHLQDTAQPRSSSHGYSKPQPPSSVPAPPSSVPEPASSLPEPRSALPPPPSSLPEPRSSLPEPRSSLPEPSPTSKALDTLTCAVLPTPDTTQRLLSGESILEGIETPDLDPLVPEPHNTTAGGAPSRPAPLLLPSAYACGRPAEQQSQQQKRSRKVVPNVKSSRAVGGATQASTATASAVPLGSPAPDMGQDRSQGKDIKDINASGEGGSVQGQQGALQLLQCIEELNVSQQDASGTPSVMSVATPGQSQTLPTMHAYAPTPPRTLEDNSIRLRCKALKPLKTRRDPAPQPPSCTANYSAAHGPPLQRKHRKYSYTNDVLENVEYYCHNAAWEITQALPGKTDALLDTPQASTALLPHSHQRAGSPCAHTAVMSDSYSPAGPPASSPPAISSHSGSPCSLEPPSPCTDACTAITSLSASPKFISASADVTEALTPSPQRQRYSRASAAAPAAAQANASSAALQVELQCVQQEFDDHSIAFPVDSSVLPPESSVLPAESWAFPAESSVLRPVQPDDSGNVCFLPRHSETVSRLVPHVTATTSSARFAANAASASSVRFGGRWGGLKKPIERADSSALPPLDSSCSMQYGRRPTYIGTDSADVCGFFAKVRCTFGSMGASTQASTGLLEPSSVTTEQLKHVIRGSARSSELPREAASVGLQRPAQGGYDFDDHSVMWPVESRMQMPTSEGSASTATSDMRDHALQQQQQPDADTSTSAVLPAGQGGTLRGAPALSAPLFTASSFNLNIMGADSNGESSSSQFSSAESTSLTEGDSAQIAEVVAALGPAGMWAEGEGDVGRGCEARSISLRPHSRAQREVNSSKSVPEVTRSYTALQRGRGAVPVDDPGTLGKIPDGRYSLQIEQEVQDHSVMSQEYTSSMGLLQNVVGTEGTQQSSHIAPLHACSRDVDSVAVEGPPPRSNNVLKAILERLSRPSRTPAPGSMRTGASAQTHEPHVLQLQGPLAAPQQAQMGSQLRALLQPEQAPGPQQCAPRRGSRAAAMKRRLWSMMPCCARPQTMDDDE